MLQKETFTWTRFTGEDFTIALSYASEESGVRTPVNIAGFRFEVRFPEDAVISTIVADITDAEAGRMSFSIPRTATAGQPGKVYKAQIWRVSPSGDEEHLISGVLTVKEGYRVNYSG